MKRRIRGNIWAAVAFLGASLLVAGGLGWVTVAALRMEQARASAALEAAHNQQIDLAMWRLENLVAPIRAAEAAQPLEHYQAFFSPALALTRDGKHLSARSVIEPSPLATIELPDWQLIHFHVTRTAGWTSPQVFTGEARDWAARSGIRPQRETRSRQLLSELNRGVPPASLLARLGDGKRIPDDLRTFLCPADPTALPIDAHREQAVRQNQQLTVQNRGQVDSATELDQQLEAFFCPSARHQPAVACEACRIAPPGLPPMVPIWLPSMQGEHRLAWVRPIATHDGLEVQGLLLDWHQLRELLLSEVSDLFPDAAIEPDPQPSERAPTKMCNLPVQLNVDQPIQAAVSDWTSLRVGFFLAWLAAVLALSVVGWGGWATLELAERRQQFVSAVTHELRTPLTTLRLYLDMLAGGMVRDEQQRAQYLSTLCAESDRLAGLVGNVLDYAQLENGQPNVNRMPVAVQPFLAEIRQVLQPLSEAAGKSLIIESEIPHESLMFTDPGLARQILANLLDNAFKHTAGSSDNRVWLRVDRRDGQITFQVEDRGPGIAASDQKRIFSSFWRGSGKNGCPAPGVGLGLALAQRWTHLLGGSLAVESPAGELGGTRFVLVLPNQPLRTEKRCIA